MDRNFTNLSNILGRPINENISEKEYTDAVNDLLKAKLRNKELNKANVEIDRRPASIDDILATNRGITNDLTRGYLNDTAPQLNLPKNNDIISKEDIQNIYNNLAKGMHNTNTRLNFEGAGEGNSGAFVPNETKETPDLLSKQFVPNSINYAANASESYNIPEILLHELTHAQDAKKYNLADIHPNDERNAILAPNEENIKDSLQATSGGHFSPETLDNLYKYPFNKIKEAQLQRITDPANYPHYPIDEDKFSQINNVLARKP